MKIVKKWKRGMCAVLIACILASSPFGGYFDVQRLEAVEAVELVTPTLLLEVILAGLGVTVSATALDNVADSFENWLSSHGSDDAISNWNAAKTMSIISISAPLITSVLAWIGEKFSDLNSGSVESAGFSSIYRVGSLSRNHSLVYDHCSAYRESGHYYLFCALPDESGYDYKGRMRIFSTASSSSRAFLVHTSVGWYIYTLNSRDELSKQSNMPSFNSVSYTYGVYPSSGEFYYSSGYFPRKDVRFDIFAETNLPVIYTSLTSVPADYFTFESLEPYVTATYNLDGIISDAFTSFGNYDSANLSNLAGLMLTPALIKTIMAGVNNTIDANKTDNGWSETVAQAVADAYAQGLADAKAQQGELEDEAKEQEKINIVTGWLSKIYDGILTIPSLVVDAWQGSWLNDILDGIVEFMQSILTGILSIPSAIVDAWEGSWLQDRLEHTVIFLDDILDGILSIPSAVVDAWENSWLKERLDRTLLFLEDISSNVKDIARSLTQEASPDDFTVSLSSLFPFCIPFDLYDMLSVLCAEPQAPRFEWQFPNGSGEMESLTIDLSKFDSVAQIVRAMEIIFFSVGLALKTRDLIRG